MVKLYLCWFIHCQTDIILDVILDDDEKIVKHNNTALVRGIESCALFTLWYVACMITVICPPTIEYYFTNLVK